MKVVVTGGAGLIGSYLAEELQHNGHEVHIIDDLSGGKQANIYNLQNIVLHKADCRNKNEIAKIFSEVRPEVVFHLAANAAENKAQFSPIDVTSRNYDAFIKVLTPFIKYGGKRFVFTSSIAVYGALQTPFKETDKPEPEDLYGITKLAAEQTLKVMSKVHGFEYVIVRPHNVYGPRQNMSDPYRNVITIWMNSILRKKPWYIYGSGDQVRCFSYVTDVVRMIYKCGFDDVANETFNIGSDDPWTLNELASAVSLITQDDNFYHLQERVQEVREAISDHTHSEKLLKDKHNPGEISLYEGLERTWKWCKKQGPQEIKKTKLELVNDKVPKNWL